MIDSRIIIHWSLKVKDWVSTIKSISTDEFEIGLIGCRNGKFLIVDSLGSVLFEKKFTDWIGTIDFVNSNQELIIFIATKRGQIHLLKITHNNWVLKEQYLIYTKDNTVREMKYCSLGNESILIAAGEDKSVSIIKFDSNFKKITDEDVYFNGWLRCLELLPDVNKNYSWIAVGCGDKNIHFYNILTKQKLKLNVGYKTHSLKFINEGGQLISSNDGNQLLVTNWKLSKKPRVRINKKITVPQRIKSIERQYDKSSNNRNLLLLGDFKSIFTFNLNSFKLIQAKNFPRQIHSLEPFRLQQSERFLLGYGSTDLMSISYSYETEDIESLGNSSNNIHSGKLKQLYIDKKEYGDIGEKHLYLTHNIYCGSIKSKIRIGIGRFIFTFKYADETYILVSTDEGKVIIFKILNNNIEKITNHKLENARAWSIGVNKNGKRELLVGTSNSTIILYNWDEVIENNIWKPEKIFTLEDWPRELRVSNFEESSNHISIGCENGDVVIIDNQKEEILFSVPNITIRSICNILYNSKELYVIGTDQNKAICFDRKGTKIWQIETKDRVREIRFLNDTIWIASEDRFLYKVSIKGNVIGRIKLPHRVLCISSSNYNGKFSIFIGCGDGNIYELTNELQIIDCYRCFDRIRDIEILNEEKLIVAASEDMHLYFFEIKSHYIEQAGEYDLEHSDNYLHACNLSLNTVLDSVLDSMRIEDKYYLLRTRNWWYVDSYIHILLYVIDSLLDEKLVIDVLDFSYEIVNSLLNEVREYDYKTAINRIEKVIMSGNEYYIHAIWTNLIHLSKNNDRNTIFILCSHILTYLPKIDSSWLISEMSRALLAIGFFENKNLIELIKLENKYNSKQIWILLKDSRLNTQILKNNWIHQFSFILTEDTKKLIPLIEILNAIKYCKRKNDFDHFVNNIEISDEIKEILYFHMTDKKTVERNKIMNLLLKHYLSGTGELVNIYEVIILIILNDKIQNK